MVKLFEFEELTIRTEEINGKIWFSGQDVFKVLGLSWKGNRDLKDRKINEKWVCKRGGESNGGLQEMIFISEIAVYKIALRANKSDKADKFTDWVAELLVNINNGSIKLVSNKDSLNKHLNVNTQKDYSKKINAVNFENGGITKTIEYNVRNCEFHTNKKPSEIIKIGKDLGLKSKQTTSAKEVLRNLKPEIACSMSLTDSLVSENNIEHKLAAQTSKDYATVLFKQLMDIGVDISVYS